MQRFPSWFITFHQRVVEEEEKSESTIVAKIIFHFKLFLFLKVFFIISGAWRIFSSHLCEKRWLKCRSFHYSSNIEWLHAKTNLNECVFFLSYSKQLCKFISRFWRSILIFRVVRRYEARTSAKVLCFLHSFCFYRSHIFLYSRFSNYENVNSRKSLLHGENLCLGWAPRKIFRRHHFVQWQV